MYQSPTSMFPIDTMYSTSEICIVKSATYISCHLPAAFLFTQCQATVTTNRLENPDRVLLHAILEKSYLYAREAKCLHVIIKKPYPTESISDMKYLPFVMDSKVMCQKTTIYIYLPFCN